jgi:hypothetical protein
VNVDSELELLNSQIADLTARRDALEAKRLLAQQTLAAVTEPLKEVAIALHQGLCTSEHGPAGATCQWYAHPDADNVEGADWTDAEHIAWLKRAQAGIQILRDAGYTVTEP